MARSVRSAARALSPILWLCGALGLEQRLPTEPQYRDTVGYVNFQGNEPCLSKPQIIAPTSVSEVRAAVRAETAAHPIAPARDRPSHGRPAPNRAQLKTVVTKYWSVKAVGAAMSWSRNQIGCAASGGANVITAGLCESVDLTAVYPFYLAPPNGSSLVKTTDILVDEVAKTATVKACVTVQALLEFLAAYRTAMAPGGYMLPHPSTNYAGATIGGVISTATYGSSLVHGGWSAKVSSSPLHCVRAQHCGRPHVDRRPRVNTPRHTRDTHVARRCSRRASWARRATSWNE